MTLPTHTIDRKTASRLLKISLRTLDRYVRQKVLCPECRHGRIWFNQAEIDTFLSRQSRQSRHVKVDKVDNFVDILPVEEVDNSEKSAKFGESVASVATGQARSKKASAGKVYRKLYEELKQKLEEKQERLEAANYRVGQLEAQLKNTVPLLTYEEERSKAEDRRREMEQQIKNKKDELTEAEKKIKEERLNRIVIATVLFIVLALQPILWFFLR